MDLTQCKIALQRTHTSALALGYRASSVMIQSPPGIGKTEAEFQYVEQMAISLNVPVGLVQFMLATIMSPDVKGFMLPVKQTDSIIPLSVFSQPPWFPCKINAWVCEPTGDPLNPVQWYRENEWTGDFPEVGVLFLDEWGQADDDVKKPAAELLLNGNVGNWRLPMGWRVTAATNRLQDRSGVMREMMFIVNRRCLINITPRLDPWLAWVETQREHDRPHYLTVSFARKQPGIVFHDSVPDGTDPYCTPRSLVKLDRDLRALRSPEEINLNKLPTDPIASEWAAGWIGGGSAGQFFAHMKFADELPELEDILDDPMTAKLPRGGDGQMVCAYMLVERITEENVSPILKYISRMSADMGIMAISTINADPKRSKFVFPTEEYREYQRKNKNVLIAASA